MSDVAEDRLATLERLISEAEERRIEQMIQIATVLADDEDATEAEDGLRQIEELLVHMRAQRSAEQRRP
jgi:hypothetical protein